MLLEQRDYVPPSSTEEKAVASEAENSGADTQDEDTEDSDDTR